MSEYVHTVNAEEQAKIASFLRWFAVGSVLFVVAVVALFVTADRWLRLISIESERRFVEPYIDMLIENEVIEGDPVLQAYVRDLSRDIDARLGSDRGLELAADELALRLVQGRYEHVGGATRLFEIIVKDSGNLQFAEFLSTHPDTDVRIKRIEALTAERSWPIGEPTTYPDAVHAVLRD